MNTERLKIFAPAARRSLLASVKGRAMIYGITSDKPDRGLAQNEGDLVRINGILYPKEVRNEWTNLLEKVEREGFDSVMEQAAYTWFNRLAALRYMEVHGYLDHRRRVLSHPEGGLRPEILEHAQDIEIPGLDRRKVLELLADGSKSEELYQYLLLQQCRALHTSLPLLFENLEPAIRLLIPDNLLAKNSIIRSFVDEIPEEDWMTTEILGWLYQFYVLEEKQRVDAYVKQGKAVQVEDIPAKTQLFTPNWIVQFLTQNSLGRLWMDVYPNSSLRDKMPYYTPPAEQEPEVAAKLREITPESLDPKTLTAIDPAAGSGHILLELYTLFFEMYREQGYPPLQIPRLILENNLHGLELDRRAAQIAGFSLLMRARAYDPQLLENPPHVQVLALRHSRDLDLAQLLSQRQAEEVFPSDRLFENDQPKLAAVGKPLFSDPRSLKTLKVLFETADVVGSLIRVPAELQERLVPLAQEVQQVQKQATLLSSEQLDLLNDLIAQAKVLAGRYSVTAMNPPYMGGRSLGKDLKEFLGKNYKGAERDVFSSFIARSLEWTSFGGYMGFMSPFTWMFISTFEDLRKLLIKSTHLSSWVQLEYSGFEGATVPVCTFTLRNRKVGGEKGSYIRLSSFKGSENQAPKTLEAARDPKCAWLYVADQDEFKKIPGSPIAYWASSEQKSAFENWAGLGEICKLAEGLSTGDNTRFLRFWWEVSEERICPVGSDKEVGTSHQSYKWSAYNKAGVDYKWSGRLLHIVDWESNGKAIKANRPSSTVRNEVLFKRAHISWGRITSSSPMFRYYPEGFIFDSTAPSLFSTSESLEALLFYLNSSSFESIAEMLAPTLDLRLTAISAVPIPDIVMSPPPQLTRLVQRIISLSTEERASSEIDCSFCCIPKDPSLCVATLYEKTLQLSLKRIDEFDQLRQEVDSILNLRIDSINHSNEPRMGSTFTGDLLGHDFLVQTIFPSFIGCMMGRFSLDEPGLIYARAGGEGFDPSRYETFPADDDGILPLTDQPYFGEEDTAERIAQWVKTVWYESPLEENLAFIAANIGQKPGESSIETIRRYLVDDFYSDHLQTYKKRPIYWLFSSGKKRAFQALVYLHRYHPGTLGRMRSQYVLPLIGKLQAQVEMADQSAADPSATASQKSQRSREAKRLKEQLAELLEFDIRLLHYANKAIALDLDDGVKVNYGKFSDPAIGDILAKVKDITGGKDD